VRTETDLRKLRAFMAALGGRTEGPGRVYLTGEATALLHSWRSSTIDVDIKAEPEPFGFFEAIAHIKDDLDLNVELASPDDFIPPLPGWRERSIFIERHGELDFCHFDLYSQALAKIERGHERDLRDVESMIRNRLITTARLREMFRAIEPDLIRYPAISPVAFATAVDAVCALHRDS
jgi:hypothetical protein